MAWIHAEVGSELVEGLLEGAVMSAINWSEVLQKTSARGFDPLDVQQSFGTRGVVVASATKGDATLAARFWEPRTPLSLADRFCLATAYRFGARAVTADRAFAAVDVSIEVLVIR
jgi:PIN domain nuclease of toxin-antitoxin system